MWHSRGRIWVNWENLLLCHIMTDYKNIACVSTIFLHKLLNSVQKSVQFNWLLKKLINSGRKRIALS